MKESLPSYLEFIAETAYQAGQITLGYFQRDIDVEIKDDETPVTAADRETEAFIREKIKNQFPGHAIFGEEYGLEEENWTSDHRWFIDPIDGTKSFIHGVPLYAVLIGLEFEGSIAAGAVYFPGLNNLLVAADGLGCWWNGRRAYVSKIEKLEQAVVAYTSIANLEKYGRIDAWQRLQKLTHFQAGWGDAYGYFLVATGKVDVMIDPIMNAWDCAPFPVILKEAGGYFGDWKGNPTIYAKESLATTNNLLDQVLVVVNGE